MPPSCRRARFDGIAPGCAVGTGAPLGLATNLARLSHDAGLPALPFLTWSAAAPCSCLGFWPCWRIVAADGQREWPGMWSCPVFAVLPRRT
jgi:hypothetical protein